MHLKSLNIPLLYLENRTIFALVLIVIFGICLGIGFDLPWLSLIVPFSLLGGYAIIFKLQWVFKLLFFLIPLSMEVALPGGIGTDFPGEPLLWILSVITVLFVITRGLPKLSFSAITVLLALHLAWVVFVSLFALHPMIAFKYALAKTWYILPFYMMPFYLLENGSMLRSVLKWFAIGTLVSALYFFIQHWQLDLTYLSRTNAGQPLWRNHVNYACTLVINLPILWYLYKSSRHPDRWIYWLWMTLFFVFIYFAYARIAYLSMITAAAFMLILRLRIIKFAIAASFLFVTGFSIWLLNNNQYLHLAPQYDKAIMQLDFEGKLSATSAGEDISTMERVHRWVAGVNMIKDRPLIGFGPGNFYNSYRPFALYSFETYVSDNPEHSGIHNYFLMLLVEQGFIGLSIFLLLLIVALIKLENQYHNCRDYEYKNLLMMTGALLTMIITINVVNDMIEVIKIGSIFFLMLYLLQRPIAR